MVVRGTWKAWHSGELSFYRGPSVANEARPTSPPSTGLSPPFSSPLISGRCHRPHSSTRQARSATLPPQATPFPQGLEEKYWLGRKCERRASQGYKRRVIQSSALDLLFYYDLPREEDKGDETSLNAFHQYRALRPCHIRSFCSCASCVLRIYW